MDKNTQHVSYEQQFGRVKRFNAAQNTQQPVAYDIIDTDHGYWQTIRADDMKRLKHFRASPGAWEVVPLYTATPAPRDVLMAFGEAVRTAMVQSCEAWEGIVEATKRVDIAAIADRYSSQVQHSCKNCEGIQPTTCAFTCDYPKPEPEGV